MYLIRILLTLLIYPLFCSGEVFVGVGKADITPPSGTPSAGYAVRKGEGMDGTHDPLLALAIFIDNGDKQIALCSVDHLGFTYKMSRNIIAKVHEIPELSDCEIYIASSHTHSGGGAYLDIPALGESLAGPYNPDVTHFYEAQTAKAIIDAAQCKIPAKIGVGYGHADALSTYRGLWPQDVKPLSNVSIIKITKVDGSPYAVLFNFPVHPTVLKGQNRLFSADFVGYAREEIKELLGADIQPIYFNGAQGDIIPVISDETNRYASCQHLGASLAKSVESIWLETPVEDTLEIDFKKDSYQFKPQKTPQGLLLPIASYDSEMNLLVLNHRHAFITIPGELSCLYDKSLKDFGKEIGFEQVSIFGLVNDAHGYIILPESWRRKTFESNLSFGGEQYGQQIEAKAKNLLLSKPTRYK